MITKLIRGILSEEGDDYTFYPSTGEDLRVNEKTGLYIHIPFCKSMCPYCPYYKVFYDEELSQRYKSALILEIKRYGEKIGRKRLTSLYIGGCTPAVETWVLQKLKPTAIIEYLRFL